MRKARPGLCPELMASRWWFWLRQHFWLQLRLLCDALKPHVVSIRGWSPGRDGLSSTPAGQRENSIGFTAPWLDLAAGPSHRFPPMSYCMNSRSIVCMLLLGQVCSS